MKEFLNKVRDFFVACGVKIKELAIGFGLATVSFGKNFFKTRKVPYYIAAAAALLAFIAGIICTAGLGMAGVTGGPVALVTVALLIFVLTSILGHEKIGTAAVGIASLFAFVLMFCQVFEYFIGIIQDQAMTGFDIGAIEGLGALITCIAMFVICAIAANVTAFLKQSRPVEAPDSYVEYVHDEGDGDETQPIEDERQKEIEKTDIVNDGGSKNGN